ncbi:hypothetical protein [Paraburkholderia sp. J63]|uniref:hypothetical protein n=1 Tax=Paraburkholderia sp. J63 TaxID=2805434 RepID=UPI002ABDEF5D|nr:hypothetical protein [Paraburkholderia sp. J63]
MSHRDQIRDLRPNMMALSHSMKREPASGKQELGHHICTGLRAYVSLMRAAIRRDAKAKANGGA